MGEDSSNKPRLEFNDIWVAIFWMFFYCLALIPTGIMDIYERFVYRGSVLSVDVILDFMPLITIFNILVILPILIYLIYRNTPYKRLLKRGLRIDCEIVEIKCIRKYGRHGRVYYRWSIICHGRDPRSGIIDTYISQNIVNDPNEYLERHQIHSVPVYVEPNNKNRYIVDIKGL